MSALLSSKQIAGTSYLQVSHGYLEAAAKVCELLNCIESLLRNLLKHIITPVH